jgi:ABC-type dipeptide/oligopeptide/nickel transport system ATPase component
VVTKRSETQEKDTSDSYIYKYSHTYTCLYVYLVHSKMFYLILLSRFVHSLHNMYCQNADCEYQDRCSAAVEAYSQEVRANTTENGRKEYVVNVFELMETFILDA